MPVLGGMRRHGAVELLLVLPDGSKSLIPAAWTDAEPSGAVGEGVVATLGSLTDLLHVCELVTGLSQREPAEQGQAAGMSPCKEDSRAACPTQFDTRSDPTSPTQPLPVPAPMVERLPAEAVATAITLLANVIAKSAAATTGSEVARDE